MTNFYESAIGSKRLLRTYEQMRTECFDDLLYCCAVTVEDAMLMGGSVPGVDYNRIDLFKLAMPLALENMKGSANSGGSKGSLITTGVPESHPMAGLEIALDAIEAEILEYIQKKPDNTLILLCHKRSRTFIVAQYGQCPKALASSTLN